MPRNKPEPAKAGFSIETESSSSSSNDTLELLQKKKTATEDESFDIIRRANKGLGGTLKTSADTSKSLKHQGHSLETAASKKKKVRDIVTHSEVTVRDIKRSGHILDFSNSFFDSIACLFSAERREKARVEAQAKEEEAKATSQESHSTDEDVDNHSEIEQLEESDPDDDVDAELEKTLAGLQALRKDVKSQTHHIKAQAHATKEMAILDKDTNKRAKSLTKKIKKLD
ncbi:hypothetical protein NEDG_01836 [Nematocida displodere]|uniref:Uncharacterized protein n=1 Tax=Nematocida displodere TaxID=1805483 RepID=A0A177EHK5_9MICR|nr:hypothetical protein NEDG_01836 [Nematocida displodere]